MDADRLEGTARNIGGKAQEGFGRATGDSESQIKGKLNQAMGAAQDLYGQAKDTTADAAEAVKQGAIETGDAVKDFILRRPYTTAVLALGIGWLVARLGHRDPMRMLRSNARRIGRSL
jgi:uncharacterized protein YjbJ (UPF0337 family)